MIPLRLKLEAAAVVVCLVFGVGMCTARDAEIRQKAVIAERLGDADRDLAVWRKHAAHAAARVDTLVDTVRTTIAEKPVPPSIVTVKQLVLDTAWARRWVDSVNRYVAATKVSDAHCLELATACTLFRAQTDSATRQYERKIEILEQMPRGCSIRSRLTWAGLGAVGGAYAWERAR